MKKILFLLLSSALLIGCTEGTQHDPKSDVGERVVYKGCYSDGNYSGASIYLYTIDGHDYGVVYEGALTHLASCKLCTANKTKDD